MILLLFFIHIFTYSSDIFLHFYYFILCNGIGWLRLDLLPLCFSSHPTLLPSFESLSLSLFLSLFLSLSFFLSLSLSFYLSLSPSFPLSSPSLLKKHQPFLPPCLPLIDCSFLSLSLFGKTEKLRKQKGRERNTNFSTYLYLSLSLQ